MASRLLTASLLTLLFGIAGAFAQAAANKAKVAPAAPAAPAVGTVGIVTGDIDSTGLRIASDLSRLLDTSNGLRIIPMIGKGSFQNISDLMTLKAVDVAIVKSDVMARILKTNRQPGIQSRMQYVAKLYSEELHVLSRMQFLCLQDLSGRRVSFGPKDSGVAITAEAVFEANNIKVDPLYLDHEDAIERLKRGEIDALVYVGGKPSHAFDKVTYKDHVHFLDVEYLPSLQGTYLPAIMTSEDYPTLIAPNESVATIGVSSVMAVHNWPPQSERYKVMSRFTESFFSEFDKLKTGTFSAKWREVNIRAPIRGWQRFQPAERWLQANAQARPAAVPPQAAQQLKTMLQKFVESQQGNAADQEDLFNQFVHWYQQQSVQQSQQQ
jgi:TRAP transporter TAXI family solute receptor